MGEGTTKARGRSRPEQSIQIVMEVEVDLVVLED